MREQIAHESNNQRIATQHAAYDGQELDGDNGGGMVLKELTDHGRRVGGRGCEEMVVRTPNDRPSHAKKDRRKILRRLVWHQSEHAP